ncbi:hypothetical protein D3C86_1907590 [compost metagenome]
MMSSGISLRNSRLLRRCSAVAVAVDVAAGAVAAVAVSRIVIVIIPIVTFWQGAATCAAPRRVDQVRAMSSHTGPLGYW